MARKVFFSFHYERDAQRAAVVRNHAVSKEHDQAAGYIDKAAWETLENQGRAAVKRWIDTQLVGTSVTVVLIGPETSQREWVRYEVMASYQRGNGLLGVKLHNILGFDSRRDYAGNTNFGVIGKDAYNRDVTFDQVARTFDWVNDNGYLNFGGWVEDAVMRAQRR